MRARALLGVLYLIYFEMAAAVLRRGHSVALFYTNGADTATVGCDNLVLAGLGRDLARCQLIIHRSLLLFSPDRCDGESVSAARRSVVLVIILSNIREIIHSRSGDDRGKG